MARIFQSGAELGAGSLLLWSLASGAGATVSTAKVRSGGYSFAISSGYHLVHQLVTPTGELYGRLGLYTGSTTGYIRFQEGTTIHISLELEIPYIVAKRGSTEVARSSATLALDRWYLVEFYVKVADSGGRIVVKIDGQTTIDWTGDTRDGGTAGLIDNFRLSGTTGSPLYFDDIAINDTTGTTNNSWCGNGYEKALVPNAAGDVAQLTPSAGSNYECVDDLPHDSDTSYVQSDTVDQVDLYNLTASGLAAGEAVNAITAVAIAKLADVGSGDLAVGIKSGATTDWSSDTPLSSDNYKTVTKLYETNPDDGGAWEAADLDALQVGVKVR